MEPFKRGQIAKQLNECLMEPHVGFACATRKLDYCVAHFRARLQSQTVKTHSSFALVCFSPIALSDILIWVDLMLWKKNTTDCPIYFWLNNNLLSFSSCFEWTIYESRLLFVLDALLGEIPKSTHSGKYFGHFEKFYVHKKKP